MGRRISTPTSFQNHINIIRNQSWLRRRRQLHYVHVAKRLQHGKRSAANPAKDAHIREGTLTLVDDDHIEFSGAACVNGKPAEDHCVTMKLVRKK